MSSSPCQTILTPAVCHSDNTCTEGLGNTGHTVEGLLLVCRSLPGQPHNIARTGFLHQSCLVIPPSQRTGLVAHEDGANDVGLDGFEDVFSLKNGLNP